METYLSTSDIAIISSLTIFLIIIYKRIMQDWNFIEKIGQRYSESDRKNKLQNHIKYITRQPVDRQKIIFKDMSLLIMTLAIMILIGTKSIFFADVVSQSMVPTFEKNDLILIQNIDRNFKVGDIIMFDRPDTALPVSHRIVSMGEDGIQTAGDATKRVDWWKLQNSDIVGKVVLIQGKPIMIKGYGKFFTVEDKNQKFGPFDYQTYNLFIAVIKAYGFGIAVVSLMTYLILAFKAEKKKRF